MLYIYFDGAQNRSSNGHSDGQFTVRPAGRPHSGARRGAPAVWRCCGRAWRNLGVAYQQAKDPDNAIAAFQRALEVQPEMPAPLYNIAIIYAAKQDADHAFEWLGKAKATRQIDMTQAEVAPELAPFRSDRANRLRCQITTHGKPVAAIAASTDFAAFVNLGPVVKGNDVQAGDKGRRVLVLNLNSRAGKHEAIILGRPGIAESGATKGADPDQSRFVHDRIAEQGFAHASKPDPTVDVEELELSL